MARSVIGALRVVLGLDSAEFETGMRRSRSQMGQMQRSMGTLATAARAMGAAIGVVSVGAAAKKYLELADASKVLTAQLKLATAQTGSFAKAQEDVKRIASATRTDIAATADLYSTLQRTAHETGLTQEEVARTTETITKAFRISGATAAEAAGGMRQFLQGIQSGTLRGEELNSVLENAPRLARALAEGLGVTIGQLRAMGQAGELTAEQVLGALGGAADQIDREFAELPKTFDEAMTSLHNAAVVTFGAFDRGGQFSTALANFVTDGTSGFSQLEASAESFGRRLSGELAGAIGFASKLIGMINGLDVAMGGFLKRAISDGQTFLNWFNPIQLSIKAAKMTPWYQDAKRGQELESRRANNRTLGTSAFSTFSEMWRQGADAVKSVDRTTASVENLSKSMAKAGGAGRRSAKAVTDAYEEAAKKLKPVLDRLFPEKADLSRYREELAMIDAAVSRNQMSADDGTEARRRLALEGYDQKYLGQFVEAEGPRGVMSWDETQKGLEQLTGVTLDWKEKSKVAAVQVAKSFKDMADDTISALDRVAGAIRGGGFLSILSSVVGLGLQLGSLGAFGKKIQTNLNTPRVPGMATGGSFTINGFAGIDTNVLSINGIPQAMVSSGERVSVSPTGGSGGGETITRVQVVPSEYFNVIVDQRAQKVAAPMAAASGHYARQAANSDIASRSRRRIPA